MTLFVDKKGPLVAPRIVGEDVSTDFGEYMGAKFGDMWDSNPVPSIDRYAELSGAIHGTVEYSGGEFGLTAEFKPPSSPLAEDEQQRRFAEAGLEAHLKPSKEYTPEAVDILIERKKTELTRQDVVNRASNWYAPAGVVAGLGAALLDPLNVATAFIPVVGEARLATLLGRAGTPLARAGVRAGVGAVDGLVGAVLIEPFTAAAKIQEQADYGMTDAMLNVGFGALFGSGLHAGTGMIGDAWRSSRGAAQPWETAVTYAPEATGALRADFQERLRAAHPGLTPEQAGAASALFDTRARTWGRDFLRTPGEYYEQYAPEFLRGGEAGGELFQAAMYPHSAPDVGSYVAAVLQEPAGAKKSFIHLGEVSRSEPHLGTAQLEFTTDSARHIANNHPEFTRFGEIAGVVAQGESVPLGHNRVTGTQTFAFVRREGGEAFVAEAALVDGKKGRRLVVLTAFTDKTKAVDHYMSTRKAAVIYQSAGENTAYPRSKGANPSALNDGGAGKTISGSAAPVKPRASFSPVENGKAVVRFFESADATSAPHELFHVFRQEMAESAASAHAPAHVRRDWQQVLDFVGAKEGEAWTVKMEEAFAREGEAFLLHGKPPSPELVGVFARLKEWFTEVYRSIRGEMNVSPAMREVFERMLATADAADRGVAELIRAMDGHPRAAKLREAYAKLSPEERQEVFQVALAQAHQGLPIDVEALVLRDAEGVRAAAEAPDLEAARVRDELGRTPEVGAALRDAAEELEGSRAALEHSAPELRQELDAEMSARLAEHDAVVARIDLEEKALLAAAECDMRR